MDHISYTHSRISANGKTPPHKVKVFHPDRETVAEAEASLLRSIYRSVRTFRRSIKVGGGVVQVIVICCYDLK